MKKFKTNVKCGACVAAITPEMNKLENTEWQVDLSHPDRILAVQGNTPSSKVIEALEKAGYKAEEI
ncbi:cation transporter [Mongoliibacter ruber]|uniref:Copper chaperone CopZ n=1 Tax=Mongoliibacter ruber TaxID=1750599 RepID=A0A2T0WI69_9BACT|nr:cation transporter [Mongoliibacter ruber]PRY86352.1 copper chaperone CopZ [Mongoliibacter ruber]